MEDYDVVFNPIFFEFEGVRPALAEVQQSEHVEWNCQTHLELYAAIGKGYEGGEEDDPEIEDIGTEQGQESILVDAPKGEDVLVVDLGVVYVPQVDLLLLGEEDVGGNQLVGLLVFEDELRSFFDVFGHLRVFPVEGNDSVSHQHCNHHKEEDE